MQYCPRCIDSVGKWHMLAEQYLYLCHEVAHTFGLDHQSTDESSKNSCIDYFSNTGANAGSTVNTKPNAHNFSELNTIYERHNTTTTIASVPGPMAASAQGGADVDVTDDSTSWGSLMKQSANGRSSTYERYNGDGSVTRTHVYWTIEAAANCPSCDQRRDFAHR
jgi:hypothetical protein